MSLLQRVVLIDLKLKACIHCLSNKRRRIKEMRTIHSQDNEKALPYIYRNVELPQQSKIKKHGKILNKNFLPITVKLYLLSNKNSRQKKFII